MTNMRDWPICRTSHATMDNLMQNKFYEIGDNTYGEDNTLIWQWQDMRLALDERNQAKSVEDLWAIERKSALPLRSLYFQQSFMIWYLSVHLQEHAGIPADIEKERPQDYSGISDEKWKSWKTDMPETFGDWLGTLD